MTHLRKYTPVLLTSLFMVIGCGDDQTTPNNGVPPKTVQIDRPENAIDGQYIFFFDAEQVTPENAKTVAEELLAAHDGTLLEVYQGGVIGFSANNLDDEKALAIGKDARVDTVGQDGYGELDEVQFNAPYSLDRLDTRNKVTDTLYEYYLTGQGVHAYVLDSGIRSTHQDFAGRIGPGMSYINDGKGTEDCNGHGTHVAGLLGGTTYGIAKKVTLHSVRIAGCDGTLNLSGLIAGIAWVIQNRVNPAVINLSAGSGAYAPLDKAALAAVKAGIPVVAAAGNRDRDACTYSPGRAPEVINVGASEDGSDGEYWMQYTNFGTCIDLFAPGNHVIVPGKSSGLVSASHENDTATAIKAGTSMAAPHVAGSVALYLELNPMATADQVTKDLMAGSTQGILNGGLFNSPNRMLYARYAEPTGKFNVSQWDDYYTDLGPWDDDARYWGTMRYADIDGDKKMDVCGRAQNGIVCRLSTGTSFGPPNTWSTFFSDANGLGDAVNLWATIRLVDLNGDGKADLCGRHPAGFHCGLSTGTSFEPVTQWDDYYTNAGPWASDPRYWATIQFADINGDKKMDICGRAQNGIVCRLSTGTSFEAPNTWATFFSDPNGLGDADNLWATIRFPDLNGDGKADVCGRHPAGFHCGISNGTSFEPVTQWEAYYTNDGPWASNPAYWETIQFADINGDKKMDICGRAVNGMVCQLSTGTKFDNLNAWSGSYFNDSPEVLGQPSFWQTIRLADINGDGKADVCGRHNSGVSCLLSRGTSFAYSARWTAGFGDAATWGSKPQYYGTIQFPDINGDGKADICGRGGTGVFCGPSVP